jgi:hypothetical protein
MDSITLGILLGESCYNWHPYVCRLFCLAQGASIGTVTTLECTHVRRPDWVGRAAVTGC